jgi:xeroderma pigmentosum group C-complementing protein
LHLKFKLDDDIETIIDRAEFRQVAKEREGSADSGAQLFCALLRSVAVDARLVCSLQVVTFSNVGQLATAQDDSPKTTIYANAGDDGSDLQKQAAGHTPEKAKKSRLTPPRLSRIGRPSHSIMGISKPPPRSAASIKSTVDIPDYPVFWVEAFNEASQKWIAVDPMITGTVGKANIIEPPMNNDKNTMSYAIAFEEDGTAKDVTRRYAHQYTAKTRRRRVEYTDGGNAWFRRLMRRFRRLRATDRDQIENAELDQKEAHEGMPRNIEDFKGHPIYVLDRHLKQNEIIHPKHVAGKIQVSRSSSSTEPVFRRRDVHIVRSAEKWYRLGREVKVGEQPLKYAKPRKSRAQSPGDDELDVFGEPLGTGLYAHFQTKQYIPPRVIDGRLPKNAYGNIDVYTPSMIPEGAVHIRSSLAAKAARLINVDYAEAKVGFRFKARRGEPVFDGAVVAQEYGDAVQAVVDGFEYAKEMTEVAQRTREVLKMWKKFFKGLMILQHVEQYKVDGEDQGFQEEMDQMDTDEEEPQYEAGGFFLDTNSGPVAQPTAVGSNNAQEESGGGFFADDTTATGGGGFVPESAMEDGGGFIADDVGGGGGFVADDEDAGGFLAEAPQEQQGADNLISTLDESQTSAQEPEQSRTTNPPVEETGGGFMTSDSPPKMTQETDIVSDPEIPQEILLESLRTKQEFEESKSAAEQKRTQEYSQDVSTSANGESASHQVGKSDAQSGDADTNDMVAPPSPMAPPSPQVPAEQDQDGSDDDSVDRGSLLSHDPEDDDLEPDWLE